MSLSQEQFFDIKLAQDMYGVADDFFYQTRGQLEFSLTRRLEGYRIQRTSRAIIAGLITITMIVLAAFNVMSNA